MDIEKVPVKFDDHTVVGKIESGPENTILIILDENISNEIKTLADYNQMLEISISFKFDPDIVRFCNG